MDVVDEVVGLQLSKRTLPHHGDPRGRGRACAVPVEQRECGSTAGGCTVASEPSSGAGFARRGTVVSTAGAAGRSRRGNEDGDGSNRRAALVGPAAERPSTCGDAVRCASVIGAMTQRRAWMPPNTLRPWSSCGIGAHAEIAVSRHGRPLPKTLTASTDGDRRLRSRTIRVVHDVSIVMMRNNQQPTIDAIFDALATTAVRVRRVWMRRSLTHRVVSPKSPRPRPRRRRRRSRRVVRRTARGDPDPAPEPPDDLSLGRLA